MASGDISPNTSPRKISCPQTHRSNMEIEDFIKNLPKVELHVHIEGTLSAELRWQLAKKNHIPLPFETLEALKATYMPFHNRDGPDEAKLGASGLAVFLEQYYGGINTLRTAEDFHLLGQQYFARAACMNVLHAEVFFDPQAHTRRGVPLEEIMSGLMRAKREAEERFAMSIRYVMCLLRDESVESARQIYEACRPYQHVLFIGLGLDSNEHKRPPELFDELFIRARRDGLFVTAHCDVGQENTHEHIRQVVGKLCYGQGLDRIDHGLSAADHPEIIDSIAERRLGMTLVPQAYIRRWPSEWVFRSIRKLHDRGIRITINSDDPPYMNDCWIAENMQIVKQGCGFTRLEMVRLSRNAIEISWADKAQRQLLLDRLDQFERDEC